MALAFLRDPGGVMAWGWLLGSVAMPSPGKAGVPQAAGTRRWGSGRRNARDKATVSVTFLLWPPHSAAQRPLAGPGIRQRAGRLRGSQRRGWWGGRERHRGKKPRRPVLCGLGNSLAQAWASTWCVFMGPATLQECTHV